MTKITPFRAWRYNPEKVQDISKVVAPPYDVIGPELLKELHRGSDFNVSWIDLPQEEGGLGKYEVAQKKYAQWKAEGVLTQEDSPSLYLYFQDYTVPDGRKFTRKGFFGRRLLEDFKNGGVKPHEKTFAGPKADRLALTQATEANLSPIFGLYSDPDNQMESLLDELSQGDPVIDIQDSDGGGHRLWVVSDPEAIQGLLAPVQSHPVMIADGHHRYETALNYRELQKAALGGNYTGEEAFNYVLMYFCSLQDPGLVVLPTHRVLEEKPEVDEAIVKDLLGQYASLKEFSFSQYPEATAYMEEEGGREHLLGWIHDDKIDVLKFDPEALLNSSTLNHLHYAVRDLDATVLHDLVLEEIMGVSKGAQREYGNIHYIKNGEDALRVTQEKKSYGFLMNATKIAQLEAVTEIGETMPQKSTFFYPKLLTGLVFNDLK